MPRVTDDEPLCFGRFVIRPAERALQVDGRDVSVVRVPSTSCWHWHSGASVW